MVIPSESFIISLFGWPNLFDWPHLILDDRPPTDALSLFCFAAYVETEKLGTDPSRSAHDICWCCNFESFFTNLNCRPSRKDGGIAGIWTCHVICKDNQEISVLTSMFSFFGWILSFLVLKCMGFPSISTVQRIGLDVNPINRLASEFLGFQLFYQRVEACNKKIASH